MKTSDEDKRSWAEMVVVAVTDELVAAGVEFPETHGEGLSPEQYAEAIRTLAGSSSGGGDDGDA